MTLALPGEWYHRRPGPAGNLLPLVPVPVHDEKVVRGLVAGNV